MQGEAQGLAARIEDLERFLQIPGWIQGSCRNVTGVTFLHEGATPLWLGWTDWFSQAGQPSRPSRKLRFNWYDQSKAD